MKKFSKIICLALCLLLVLQVALLAACNKKKGDPETTPLVLSTDPLDGVFNPFSYTSGADGGVVGQTQLGLLSMDKDGKVVAGWDEPCVAEGFSVVTVGSESDYERDGDYSNYYTDYFFALKDGIKFSDGTPLTIKDVLFNMYVYLDPVYTGSSTMYSIDIQGLSAYRTQSDADDAQNNTNALANANATQRVERLESWCGLDNDTPLDQTFSGEELVEVQEDISKIKELFREELNTDWVSAATNIEEYEKYYKRDSETDKITTGAAWKAYTAEGNTHKHISEQWEVFAMMYGLITATTTQLNDSATTGIRKYTFEYNGADGFDHSQTAMVNRVFSDFFPSDENGAMFKSKLLQVITNYATKNTFFEYVVNDEKGKLLHGEEMHFKNISGITVYEANKIPTANASQKGGDAGFDGNRTILKIRINGLDPKAILSFSFSIAPMNYYSTQEAIGNFKSLPDSTITVDGEEYTQKNYEGFGVEYASPDFMNVINTNLVPRGAGPYRPSNGTQNGVGDAEKVQRTQFYSNNIVNFERNNYFQTVMRGGHNAYIKFLRYKVVATNAMVDAVTGTNPEVHVSMTAPTADIAAEVNKISGVKPITVDYMGYGYIGINAEKVHDINVRRAIMSAMDVTLCSSYYGSNEYVSIIYRSMSKNSWAYPEGCTAHYEYDPTGAKSKEYLDAALCAPGSDGILRDSEGNPLKFTFTVAGETEDHPAYQTMAKAAEILNKLGMDITVSKDTQALSKLASGGLEIWAAAWSSASDPDMYQVYHKDSTASSVKNWGYPHLLRDGTQEEQDILDRLAEQIELGRKYATEQERKPYYSEALDLVMELAVELPTYQRKDLYLINSDIVDVNTLCEATVYQSPVSQIWNINFVGASK